jgi:hypothetical protein
VGICEAAHGRIMRAMPSRGLPRDSRRAATLLVALVAIGCVGRATPAPAATNPPVPSTGCGMVVESPPDVAAPRTFCTTAPGLTLPALRISLIQQLGPRWYCDPDVYPVAIADELGRAIERYDELRKDSETFDVLTSAVGIDLDDAPATDAEKLELYRLWKSSSTIELAPIGGDRYRFDYLAMPAGAAQQGVRTAGIIGPTMLMTIEQQAPADGPNCPI